ncbi:hypothetical protein [Alkalicoccobacillus porphyridii]|uniref:hypothetical protein n=1 Tax=Alkalicoccobacillus porphyridii TaxID=2597270 RepID=UPI00163D6B19|nr:hypothetical protein [Alkalicoccobacillus porphyridii]
MNSYHLIAIIFCLIGLSTFIFLESTLYFVYFTLTIVFFFIGNTEAKKKDKEEKS